MSTLPLGWATATFGTVADIQLGKMLDKAKNKGEPTAYLRNVNVRWGSFDLSDLAEMRMTLADRISFEINDGDILVCEGGEPGRAAVWRSGPTAISFQKALMRVRPSGGIQSSFLQAFLRFAASDGRLSDHFTGTTIKHLPQSVMREVALPLAPVAEQRRIVAKLDNLTARTARARAELDRIPDLAAQCRQQLLEKAFSGGPSADRPEGWKPLTLGELGKWGSGGTPKSGRTEYYGGAIPWVRSGDLTDGPVSHEVTITEAGLANSSAKWVPEGAVLLAMYGATIGKVGLTTYPVTTNQAVASLQCEQSLISPSFALWLLRSLKPAFVAAGQGGAQPNISQTIIKSWPARVPSLEKQEQVVRGLERAFSDIDRLAAEAASAHRLLDRLDQAVLAKAFRGELVPQDPTDEPVDVLLDRIRAERAGSPKAKRRLSSHISPARKKSDMPKSRLDDDVKHQPFLALILRASDRALSADSLFESADLPITDFYKQLAWEIDNGLVKELGEMLEAA